MAGRTAAVGVNDLSAQQAVAPLVGLGGGGSWNLRLDLGTVWVLSQRRDDRVYSRGGESDDYLQVGGRLAGVEERR